MKLYPMMLHRRGADGKVEHTIVDSPAAHKELGGDWQEKLPTDDDEPKKAPEPAKDTPKKVAAPKKD